MDLDFTDEQHMLREMIRGQRAGGSDGDGHRPGRGPGPTGPGGAGRARGRARPAGDGTAGRARSHHGTVLVAATDPGMIAPALLGGDVEEIREWVADVLGPLASDTDDDACLVAVRIMC